MSASRPYGAKMVPRTAMLPTDVANVGSHSIARSHAMLPAASSCRTPSISITGRTSAGPVPAVNSAEPANSTAARAPRCSAPTARRLPSAGWMHGRVSQWFPVNCQGTVGSGAVLTGSGCKFDSVMRPAGNLASRRSSWSPSFSARASRPVADRQVAAGAVAAAPCVRLPRRAGSPLPSPSPRSCGCRCRDCWPSASPASVPTRSCCRTACSESSVGGTLQSWNSTFGSSAAGVPTTNEVPLGAPFSGTAVGASLIGGLAPLETRLQELTGLPTLQLTVGDVAVQARARSATLPIRLEFGLGRRLQLSAGATYFQTRVDARDIVNRAGSAGNVGYNPALDDAAAANRNALLVAQLEASATALQDALAACATTTSPACADPAAAEAAAASAQALAQSVSAVYGSGDAGSGAALVPRTGSAAAAAVAGRLSALRTTLDGFGVTALGETTAPANALQPLTSATFGPALAALGVTAPGSASHYGMGDVEIGARLALLNGIGDDVARAAAPTGVTVRATADALVRLPIGEGPRADRLLDVAVGDGHTTVEFGGVADVLVGRRFWASAALHYGLRLPGDETVRLPSAPGQGYLAASSEQVVSRDPGDYLRLEITPRLALGEFVAISLPYQYRRVSADETTLSASPSQAPLAVDALDRAAEGYVHRLGVGITLSTLSSYAAGRVGAPLDVSYVHSETLSGAGRGTARASIDAIQLRLYLSAFGRR